LESGELISEYRLLLRELKILQQALPFKPLAADSSPYSKKGDPDNKNGPSFFMMDDLQDPGSCAKELRASQDPLSQYILEQFSTDAKRLLKEYDGISPPSEALKQAMVDELNRLLKDGCIYEEKRFAKTNLTENTQKIIEKDLQGEDLIRLNRLLLEEAFPQEIAKSHNKSI